MNSPDPASGPDPAGSPDLATSTDSAGESATSGGSVVGEPVVTAAAGRLARLITEVLAPWVIVLVLPLGVAWQATRTTSGTLLWGFVVSVTSSLLPMLVILWGARTGRWDGHHVRNREGRLVPFLALIGLSSTGLGLLVLGGAPWPMTALDLSMITTLLATWAITAKWKISMHTAVAGGAVVMLTTTYDPRLWVLTLLVIAIGWSRVWVGDHTPAQVVGGVLVGALIGGGSYITLL